MSCCKQENNEYKNTFEQDNAEAQHLVVDQLQQTPTIRKQKEDNQDSLQIKLPDVANADLLNSAEQQFQTEKQLRIVIEKLEKQIKTLKTSEQLLQQQLILQQSPNGKMIENFEKKKSECIELQKQVNQLTNQITKMKEQHQQEIQQLKQSVQELQYQKLEQSQVKTEQNNINVINSQQIIQNPNQDLQLQSPNNQLQQSQANSNLNMSGSFFDEMNNKVIEFQKNKSEQLQLKVDNDKQKTALNEMECRIKELSSEIKEYKIKIDKNNQQNSEMQIIIKDISGALSVNSVDGVSSVEILKTILEKVQKVAKENESK